jgi:hypothetical protein
MAKKRFPEDVVARVDSLIRRVAEARKKTDPDYAERGLPNGLLVQACLEDAKDIMRRQYDEMVSGYLAVRIPLVLPAPSPTERTSFATIPGLDLPVWLSVPSADQHGSGWKYQPDLTPNEITRVIKHREQDIEGRVVEKNKLVLLRDTALEQGCEPDDPIRTVFDGDDPDGDPLDEHRPTL